MAKSFEHDVNHAREDLKAFLNEETKHGLGVDVLLCVLYEAVYQFENIVTGDILKTGKNEGAGSDKVLNIIKQMALKNVSTSGNWE
jgi:hypothetical protein